MTLTSEMTDVGKARQLEALRPALLGGPERTAYAEIAAALGVSEEVVRALAHRLRRRYRELIREEVARTVYVPADVDGEIRSLITSLSV